jgi:predicted transcriptional regulator YdeE
MMHPKHAQVDEIKVIGIGVRTFNNNEANPTTAKIPRLWDRFFAEDIGSKVPNRVNLGALLAVYTNYDSDYMGEYDLVVSAEVSSLDEIPEGTEGLSLPPSEYLIFAAQGKMPDVVVQTWDWIWRYFSQPTEYQRAYTADFELYKGENAVDIYIAVQPSPTDGYE